jgi:hypothetical protein
MGHRRHGLAVCIGVRLGSLRSDERLARTRMLTVGEPLELIRMHIAGQSPQPRELTVPLSATNSAQRQ